MVVTAMTADVDEIRELVRPVYPTASVYLARPPAETDVDRYFAELSAYPEELAVFAAEGEIRMVRRLSGGVDRDIAGYAAPARLGPLLAWLQRHPAYVVAVVDRTGADLTSVPAGALAGPTRVVAGPDDEVERNAPGGWSQPRYQRRAEDSWPHNAAAVAEAVGEELHRVHADLLLVAGDVRCGATARRTAAPQREAHSQPSARRPEPGRVGRRSPSRRSRRGTGLRRRAHGRPVRQVHSRPRAAPVLRRGCVRHLRRAGDGPRPDPARRRRPGR